MYFANFTVLLRGGGDLATGVAHRLNKAGFPLIILELAAPMVVRRRVALASAVLEGEVVVEDLHGRLVGNLAEAMNLSKSGIIPVLISPELPRWPDSKVNAVTTDSDSPFTILIDARMAKRTIDTRIDQAPFVLALGPGFTAGVDCHVVIETKRGHRLGRTIWKGQAQPNTGTPGLIAGRGAERVLRAPTNGVVSWEVAIGDTVQADQLLGHVEEQPVIAPFVGVLRGLIAPGTSVSAYLKIGDLDARADVSACFTISDKALAIGGGVLEAILTWMNDTIDRSIT